MDHSEINSQKIKEIASSLCGAGDTNVFPIEGGRNSRIYRVENNGNIFALKFFRPDKEGKRERFEAETSALELFARNGMWLTPRVIAKDQENNCVLMEWIEGEKVEDYGVEDISILVEFVQKVHGVACNSTDQKIRYATEACLNGSEIVRQINSRLSRLDVSKNQYPKLKKFLNEEFVPAINEISQWSQKQYECLSLDFSKDISLEQQTLSVSDFGFHNALRRDDIFYFLDFEFFGWDDPVKLVADTLQHPGMTLDDEKKQVLFSGLINIFDKDEMFLTRLKLLYPLFGLKWCMIMLNSFLPGYQPLGTQGVIDKDKQLDKVRTLTRSTHECYKEYPYAQYSSGISARS